MTALEPKLNDRLEWLDAAKAIAMIFVVLGHVLRGLHSAALLSNEKQFLVADQAIYLFHMPAFFLISGYTFAGLNRPWFDFIGKLAKSILLPYFIWSAVLIVMIIMLSGVANADANWFDLARIIYQPYSIFFGSCSPCFSFRFSRSCL